MKENKLKIKDLVTIGVFAVIYFVFMFGVGMIGVIPILFLIYPTILGMLSPLIMFLVGHTYVLVLHALVVMFIAEMIRRVGNYKSLKFNMIAFAVFNTWICGSLMQMLWAREKYIELSMMMGKEYVDAMISLITYPHMALVYAGALVGGLVGAYIGKNLLRKHFTKAGIV